MPEQDRTSQSHQAPSRIRLCRSAAGAPSGGGAGGASGGSKSYMCFGSQVTISGTAMMSSVNAIMIAA